MLFKTTSIPKKVNEAFSQWGILTTSQENYRSNMAKILQKQAKVSYLSCWDL